MTRAKHVLSKVEGTQQAQNKELEDEIRNSKLAKAESKIQI